MPSLKLEEGDVRLPRLVGQRRLEANVGASRSLVRLRLNEAPAFEDPPDRRDRRGRGITQTEVVVDRLGAGVEALIGELLAETNDAVLELHYPVESQTSPSASELIPAVRVS